MQIMLHSLFAALLAATTASASPPRNAQPQTIPALREWRGGHGQFQLGPSPRIVVGSGALRPEARTFAADLRKLTHRTIGVADEVEPRPGDIRIALGARDAKLGGEGYALRIGRTLGISARKPRGAFWGTRTVLQLLRQSEQVPRGTARDWPRYPYRGLMVDNGRKYFTPGWLEREIKDLSYLKLNRLHLHFSDDQGFRIASRSHPEIVSNPHLTYPQVRHLVAVGQRYHVELVPEIDMPGHMQAALASHPELQLADAAGNRAPDKLDYTKPAARRFARDLVREYMKLFPAREWHMGADEFLSVLVAPTPADYARYPQLGAYAKARYGPSAIPEDGFLGFVNSIDRLVRNHGKGLHVWNDALAGGSAVTLNPDVAVEWWNNPNGPGSGPGPQDFVDAGHAVLNAGWFPTYYVSGGPTASIPPRPDMAWAYEDWDPSRFLGAYYTCREVHEPEFTLAPGEPKNLGAELHVWNDDPAAQTESQIGAAIAPRLRVIAQKTWGSRELASDYAGFQRIAARIGKAP